MSSHSLPPSTSQDGFKSITAKNKSTVRDYAIYATVLVILIGLIGGSIYYFTRPKAEKDQIRAKFEHTKDEVLLGNGKEFAEPPAMPELKTPKQLDGLLDEGTAAPKSPSNNLSTKTGGVSTYAGGKQNSVLPSDDPALPKPDAAFIQFAESLKISGVLPGDPAKAVLNGHLFRAGTVLDAELGVTFAGVDGNKSLLILRDKTGAELHLTY